MSEKLYIIGDPKKVPKKAHVSAIIDLDGPDGNAFMLMATLKKSFKLSGLDPDPVLAEMKSSDYTHLVKIFYHHLAGTFTLVSKDKELHDKVLQK